MTPEARFITLCAREPDAVHADALRSAAAMVRDWDATAAAAARHRVAAFVGEAAERSAVGLPPHAGRALRQAALAAVAHVMRLNQELERVVAAMEGADVAVIVLKGPVLARTVYPRAVLRPYNDLDLTIRDEEENVAVATILECGYREVAFAPEEARRSQGAHVHESEAFHRVFETPDLQSKIDLHVDPLQLGLKSACEAQRWRRAVPVPGLSHARMLSTEDQLVQLSVHAHKHGFNRLIWLKDLDLLLRAYRDELDWDLVLATARQDSVEGSVWYALGLAEGLFRTPVPRLVLRQLRPARVVRALYNFIWPTSAIMDLNGQMRKRAVQFNAGESWRGMLPSLLVMGRRRDRARAILQSVLHR